MNKLQFLTLATLLAILSLEFSISARPCLVGEARNAQGKCVKKSRVDKAKTGEKAKKAELDINYPIESAARNAMNAYNQNRTSSQQISPDIQQAALDAVNKVIKLYTLYANDISQEKTVNFTATVALVNPPAQANNTAATAQNPSLAAQKNLKAISACDDGATAVCVDGTSVVGVDCGDGTVSDANGMCSDYSLIQCDNGDLPLCNDGTAPLPAA